MNEMKRVYINVEGKLLDSKGKPIDPQEIGDCLNELPFVGSVAIQKLSSTLKVYILIRESNYGGKSSLGRTVWSHIEKQFQLNYPGSMQIVGLPVFPVPCLERITSTTESKPEPEPESELDWAMFNQLQSYPITVTKTSAKVNKSKIENEIIAVWSKYLNIPEEYIDLDDNLFTLGGNLFLAGRIASSLFRSNYPITIETIISNPTVRGLASIVSSSSSPAAESLSLTNKLLGTELTKPLSRSTDSANERKSLLSWTQRWVFIHEQLLGKGNYYFFDVSYELRTGLTSAVIETALNQLVSSVELLRSYVRVRGSSHYLAVSPKRELTIPLIKAADDEEARSKIDEKKASLNIVDNEINFLFDALFIETPEVTCLTLIIHHLIVDDLSFLLLEEKLLQILQNLQTGTVQPGQSELVSYIDYTVWVTREIQRKSEIIDPLEDYWLERLKDLPKCIIPVNYDENNPPKEPKVSGKHSMISLSIDETNGAKALVRSVGTTLDILAEALVKVVLYKLTGVGDTVIKRLISARLHPSSYEMIGHFNNMIYSRTCIKAEKRPTFTDILKDFHSSWLADFNARGYPWINTVAQTNVEHVLPAGISVIGLPEERCVDDNGLPVKIFKVNQFTQVSFELVTCIYGIHEDKLHYCLNYNEDLLDPEVINSLVNAFEVLLRRAVTYTDRPIDDYFNMEPAFKVTQWSQETTSSQD